MQQIKTVTVKTSNKVKSVHVDTLYNIIENCYNRLQIIEADCTGANYFLASANIFAQLQELYAENTHNTDYVAIDSVMEVFANNLTYTDEKCLYTDAVENTAMQKINLRDFVCLSN